MWTGNTFEGWQRRQGTGRKPSWKNSTRLVYVQIQVCPCSVIPTKDYNIDILFPLPTKLNERLCYKKYIDI